MECLRRGVLALLLVSSAAGCEILDMGGMGCWTEAPVTGSVRDFSAKDTASVRMLPLACATDQGVVQIRGGGKRTVSLKAVCAQFTTTPCFTDVNLAGLVEAALAAEHIDATVGVGEWGVACEKPNSNFSAAVSVYTLDWRATTRIAQLLLAVLEEEDLSVDVAIDVGRAREVCS